MLAQPRLFALTVLVAVPLLFVSGSSSAGPTSAHPSHPCTHGSSSIGPITFSNGHIVGGTTTPHTDACLP